MSDPVKVPPLKFEEEEEGTPPQAQETKEDEEFEIVLKGQEDKQNEPPKPDEDEELPPQYKGKSKKELVELLERSQESGNQALALKSAIEGLGERLAQPGRPQKEIEREVKQALLDDPTLVEKFNKELFGDNPYGVLKPAVEKIVEGVVARYITPMAGMTHETQKQLLMLDPEDGPVFRKYRAEIERFVAELEPQYRANPGVWRYALGEIQKRHFKDIVSEQVAEELKKQQGAKPQFGEPGGGPREPPKKGKRKVVIDVAEMEECELRGIPKEQYIRMKAEGEI